MVIGKDEEANAEVDGRVVLWYREDPETAKYVMLGFSGYGPGQEGLKRRKYLWSSPRYKQRKWFRTFRTGVMREGYNASYPNK